MSTSALIHEAISSALCSDWKRAIALNEQILHEQNDDIDTLNRLGFAFTQLGDIEKAKKIYRKIFTIDRYNLIALKNYEKLATLPQKVKRTNTHSNHSPIAPSLFLEEPGKTKTVTLIHPAPITILSHLRVGILVYFYPKKHTIELRDDDKNHIGALPDDVAFRLLHFMKMGNTYEAYIKNIEKNSVSVFIKEKYRGKRLRNQPTFQTGVSDYTSSAPRELKTALDTGPESSDDQSGDAPEE